MFEVLINNKAASRTPKVRKALNAVSVSPSLRFGRNLPDMALTSAARIGA